MSGVGKTHLAKLLSDNDTYFHYSGDYRIGSEYLNNDILDNVKARMRQDPCLAELLDDQAVDLVNQMTFDNLSSVSNFLGKVGNPEQGGLPLGEFKRRQALHRQAEVKAMCDVPGFIDRARQAGFSHFINDAGGSLCELDDDTTYELLSEHTLILYIKANDKNVNDLIERARTHPKPLYYQSAFLDEQLKIYLSENQLTYVAQINPNAFVRWIFPRLLEHRVPKYEAIAQRYGYTIDSQALYQCQNAEDVFQLIEQVLD